MVLILSSGRPRSINLYKGGESCPLQTVSRHAAVESRSSSCLLPQASRYWNPTYYCRAGQCTICLPTTGRALHGAYHQSPIQHSSRHWFSSPIRAGCLQHLQKFGWKGDFKECIRASKCIWRTSHTGIPGEPYNQPNQDIFGDGESWREDTRDNF